MCSSVQFCKSTAVVIHISTMLIRIPKHLVVCSVYFWNQALFFWDICKTYLVAIEPIPDKGVSVPRYCYAHHIGCSQNISGHLDKVFITLMRVTGEFAFDLLDLVFHARFASIIRPVPQVKK